METGSTKAISEVKQELRLREWSEQIERQQSSGLSVEQWCDENGINPKTYYYRLRKVLLTAQQTRWLLEGLSIEQSKAIKAGKARKYGICACILIRFMI